MPTATNLLRPLDQAAQRICAPLLSYDRVLIGGIALYYLVIWIIRAFVFPDGTRDDIEQLLFAQSWELGYQMRNPPLATWIYALVEQVTGPSLVVVLAVKFATLMLFFVLLHRLAWRFLPTQNLVAIATLTPLALFEVSYVFAFDLSHSVLLITLCAGFALAYFRLDEAAGWREYLLIGVLAGAGLLTKHNFGLFLTGLLAAGLCDSVYRPLILNRRMAAALALALAMATPHYIWLIDHLDILRDFAADKFRFNGHPSTVARIWISLFEVTESGVASILPAAAMLLVFFFQALPKAFARTPSDIEQPAQRRRLKVLGLSVLIMFVLVFLLTAISGATQIHNHYFYVFILTPLALLAWLARGRVTRQAQRAYVCAVLLLALVSPVILPIRLVILPDRKPHPPYNVEIAQAADALREAGFEGGTIYGTWKPYEIAGRLRPHFPGSRSLTSKYPYFIPARRDATGGGDCLIFWGQNIRDQSPEYLDNRVRERFGIEPDYPLEPNGWLKLDLAFGKGRTVPLRYTLIKGGVGTCR